MTRGNRKVAVRRVYDAPSELDGARVLVDRIWPRGLPKSKAALDEWCKEVAPSDALRKWYGHDPAKFAEFSRRYEAELTEPGRRTPTDAVDRHEDARHQPSRCARRAADSAQVMTGRRGYCFRSPTPAPGRVAGSDVAAAVSAVGSGE
jgi:uncharacterized protein YeaO (DUF488 family)